MSQTLIITFIYFIILFSLFFIIILPIYIFFPKLKKFCKKILFIIKKNLFIKINKIKTIYKFYKNYTFICENIDSKLLNLIFITFVDFYEKNCNELDNIEYDRSIFPLGKYELSLVYNYIKKIRIDNYNKVYEIMYKDHGFIYHKTVWNNITYKIKNNVLEIFPSKKNKYNKNKIILIITKMLNELYLLDNEKAKWIIENRKYFGI